MERRLLKEIVLDQRAVFDKKRPGTTRDVLAEVGRHIGKPHAITLAGVRRGLDVAYYKTASGREVDFACRRGRVLGQLIQVTLSMADPRVRAREADALAEALDEQNLDTGLVLTESERDDMAAGKRTIKVRPLANWLCGLEG